MSKKKCLCLLSKYMIYAIKHVKGGVNIFFVNLLWTITSFTCKKNQTPPFTLQLIVLYIIQFFHDDRGIS